MDIGDFVDSLTKTDDPVVIETILMNMIKAVNEKYVDSRTGNW